MGLETVRAAHRVLGNTIWPCLLPFLGELWNTPNLAIMCRLNGDTSRVWSTYCHFCVRFVGKTRNSTNTQRVVQSYKSSRAFVAVLAWKQRTSDVFLFVAHLSLGSSDCLYPYSFSNSCGAFGACFGSSNIPPTKSFKIGEQTLSAQLFCFQSRVHSL